MDSKKQNKKIEIKVKMKFSMSLIITVCGVVLWELGQQWTELANYPQRASFDVLLKLSTALLYFSLSAKYLTDVMDNQEELERRKMIVLEYPVVLLCLYLRAALININETSGLYWMLLIGAFILIFAFGSLWHLEIRKEAEEV